MPHHVHVPSLTPLGLTLHSAFFQSFFRQFVCWSLNSSLTKVPAGKGYPQTEEGQQSAEQAAPFLDVTCPSSLPATVRQHVPGDGWAGWPFFGELGASGAQAPLYLLPGNVPTIPLPSLGCRSPCPWHCPHWSPGRSTARADACGTPPGPPAGPGAGPP